MSSTGQLIDAVREAAHGSPYVVEEKPYGFDLTIDVVDAQWWTLLRRHGLERVFTYEVRTDEAEQKLSITEVSNVVQWSAGEASGEPRLHAEKSVQKGRVHQFEMHKEVGVDARTGELGMPVDFTFSSGEGRTLIRDAAEKLGWSEKMGAEQKIGLLVAAAVVVVGVLIGLFLLARALFS